MALSRLRLTMGSLIQMLEYLLHFRFKAERVRDSCIISRFQSQFPTTCFRELYLIKILRRKDSLYPYRLLVVSIYRCEIGPSDSSLRLVRANFLLVFILLRPVLRSVRFQIPNFLGRKVSHLTNQSFKMNQKLISN